MSDMKSYLQQTPISTASRIQRVRDAREVVEPLVEADLARLRLQARDELVRPPPEQHLVLLDRRGRERALPRSAAAEVRLRVLERDEHLGVHVEELAEELCCVVARAAEMLVRSAERQYAEIGRGAD